MSDVPPQRWIALGKIVRQDETQLNRIATAWPTLRAADRVLLADWAERVARG